MDLVQYIAGYLENLRLLKRVEHERPTEVTYDPKSPLYRAQGALFYAKQVTAIVAVCWLIAILSRKVWA